MGLDVGEKRIGIALSDELLLVAHGHSVLERTGIKKDTSHIMEIAKTNGCSKIVLGLPLNMDGSSGLQARLTEEFGKALENKLRSNGLPNVEIIYRDERLTSLMAEKVLLEADVKRKDRKAVIDKMAAVIILQSYLDSLIRC